MDRRQLTFYTADDRIDFRELVRDLARRFGGRIPPGSTTYYSDQIRFSFLTNPALLIHTLSSLMFLSLLSKIAETGGSPRDLMRVSDG